MPPNDLELTGDGGVADGVRCSDGLGDAASGLDTGYGSFDYATVYWYQAMVPNREDCFRTPTELLPLRGQVSGGWRFVEPEPDLTHGGNDNGLNVIQARCVYGRAEADMPCSIGKEELR